MNDLKQTENEYAHEHPDHIKLFRLLQQARPIVMPMFPDQRKRWIEESPLAQEISAVLARHPEYYDEFRTLDGGIFSELKP
jgi:hypothetical protein